jgi:hypothetical protein
MHDLASVDDKRLPGNPQTEEHALFGEQDGGAARTPFGSTMPAAATAIGASPSLCSPSSRRLQAVSIAAALSPFSAK